MVPFRYPLTVFACSLLFGTATAQGQAHSIFSSTTRSGEAIFRSDVLAEAETRMRIVQQVPNGPDGTIDLSAPLDIELFPDVRYTVQLRPDQRSAMEGLEVWKGRVDDARFDHLPHYVNTVFVLNRNTGKLVANIETEKGFFQVLPTAHDGYYRVRQCKGFDGEFCRMAEQASRSASGERSNCGGGCDETDADGRYVVDVFAGYSSGAVAVAGDVAAHAQANIETANTGLANSQVDTLYLRLVGTAVGGENPGIVTSVLDDAWDWFAPEIEALAPDIITLFQTPTNDPGSAGGWGAVPGRATVCGVGWPTVFRHEVGHNSGGSHCYPDNEEYMNGHDNGHWRTHMCGNDVNFYSTPLLNDNQGNPIGDAEQADMARNWNERARAMANHNVHRVPFFEGDSCAGMPCMPAHWGDPIEYIRRVQFNTLDNLQTDPSWNCDQVTGYSDFLHLSTEVARGEQYELNVEASYSWEESTLRAWIDWNGDGIFQPGDMVMDRSGQGPWSEMVAVPADAFVGGVRLRIRLQFGLEEAADPCQGSAYSSGESEDYTVFIEEGSAAVQEAGGIRPGHLGLFPNPATESLAIQAPESIRGTAKFLVRDLGGRCVKEVTVNMQSGQAMVDMGMLAPGPYTCELHHGGGVFVARMLKQ